MAWQSVVALAIIGIAAGLLSGLLGLGGAVIIIPALVMFMGYSQQMAQGTTLAMMVLPIGALAAWQYYDQGFVQWKAALILAGFFFVSSFFGARFAVHIPELILKKSFALLLIIIALKILFID